ncbi:MAG: prepilin peptidase [Oliverpabstia sp.]
MSAVQSEECGMNGVVLIYLAVNAWTDGKRREINLIYTIIFLILTALCRWNRGQVFAWTGMIPGFFLWMLSVGRNKNIGSGDGILCMALGLVTGIEILWNVMLGGFCLAGVWGVIAWIGQRKRTSEIPFVPFLLASYLINCLEVGN